MSTFTDSLKTANASSERVRREMVSERAKPKWIPTKREAIESAFALAYQAQLSWSQTAVRVRAKTLAAVRGFLVERRRELAEAITAPMRTGYHETLTSEILPLADAAKWLGGSAARVLASRHLDGGGSPWWLGRLRSVVHRVPRGMVLIVGTWNYPIFLTGVQVLQALVAGNAVAIKPAPGCEEVTEKLVDLLLQAGVPPGLVVLLESSVDAGKLAMDIGVDHVVVTGSSGTGRAIQTQIANSLTTSTMELSGCDAVYVLPGGDMLRVADLLRFGLRLNGGATCMAPRRVFVTRKASEVFHRVLSERLNAPEQARWSTCVSARTYHQLWDGVEDAIAKGASLFSGNGRLRSIEQDERGFVRTGHVVLTDVTTDMSLYSRDIFAPLVMIVPVDSWADALKADSKCPYALSASVFGPVEDALRIVPFISAGTVTINDMIVPTVDPRLPFGGRGESGFGVTRGIEGLLSMTTTKVVSTRLGSWLPHAKLPEQGDEQVLDGLLQFLHGRGWHERWVGIRQLIEAVVSQRNQKKKNEK